MSGEAGPLLSIVIPTKDSACTLEACLRSIAEQDYRNHEIIVVDCFSKDGTPDIAKGYGATVIQSDAGPAGARNTGFGMAAGNILVSIDSDMILEPSLLSDIVASIDGHGALIIPEVGHGDDFFSRCKDLEKRCYIGDPIVESARAFRREAFDAVGGYDPGLHFGEDLDFHSRLALRFSIGRVRSNIMHDTSGMSLLSQMKKSFIYGKTLPRYLEKDPRSPLMDAGRRIFFIRYFHRLREDPLHAIGLFFIKIFEHISGLAGLLSAKLGL